MLKITLITLGHLKEKYLRGACDEYVKRLGTLCSLKIIELEPAKLSDKPSESEIKTALSNEADKISSLIPNNAYLIPLCIEGKQLDSVELSQKLEQVAIMGKTNVCFVIGSSYGIDDGIKQKADLKLSMSKMTFPHQLARVMLLEQIYRAFKITQGATYHK